MDGDSLVRRVLIGLVSPASGSAVHRPRDVAAYSRSRRVLAGLLGVTLPPRPPSRTATVRARPGRPAAGRAIVFRFSRVQASAAHGADSSRPVEAIWSLDDDTTVRCHNRPGLDQIEITLVTTRGDRHDVLLPLRVDGTGYLMLVATVEEAAGGRAGGAEEHAGGAEGRVVARTHAAAPQIEFEPAPRTLASLGAADAEEVNRSVNGSSRAALELWRAEARRRAAGDPLRAAIVAGLP